MHDPVQLLPVSVEVAAWTPLRRGSSWRAIQRAVDDGAILRVAHGRYALPSAEPARSAASRLTGRCSHDLRRAVPRLAGSARARPTHVTVSPHRNLRRIDATECRVTGAASTRRHHRRLGHLAGPHRHRLLPGPAIRRGAGGVRRRSSRAGLQPKEIQLAAWPPRPDTAGTASGGWPQRRPAGGQPLRVGAPGHRLTSPACRSNRSPWSATPASTLASTSPTTSSRS